MERKIHIGKVVKRIADERGMKYTELAKRMNTSPQNVQGMFSRATLQTETLVQLSEVLNHDFFEHYRKKIISVVNEPKEQYGKNKEDVEITLNIRINPYKHESLLRQLLGEQSANLILEHS